MAAKTSHSLNLCHILSYPITAVPRSLAHSDETLLKTDKATLNKALGDQQDIVLTDANLTPIKATVIDGGIILHETLIEHSKSTYGSMAKDLLEMVCRSHGEQILLVQVPVTIHKHSERILCSSDRPQEFIITGPDQFTVSYWDRTPKKWRI